MGGSLMGLGASLAVGCTVGGFFIPLPLLHSSPTGWAMWLGLIAGAFREPFMTAEGDMTKAVILGAALGVPLASLLFQAKLINPYIAIPATYWAWTYTLSVSLLLAWYLLVRYNKSSEKLTLL